MTRVLAHARGLDRRVYGRTAPLVRQAVRPAHADRARQRGKTDREADLVDGAVEELLFGW
jgi:hypothetical protein